MGEPQGRNFPKSEHFCCWTGTSNFGFFYTQINFWYILWWSIFTFWFSHSFVQLIFTFTVATLRLQFNAKLVVLRGSVKRMSEVHSAFLIQLFIYASNMEKLAAVLKVRGGDRPALAHPPRPVVQQWCRGRDLGEIGISIRGRIKRRGWARRPSPLCNSNAER